MVGGGGDERKAGPVDRKAPDGKETALRGGQPAGVVHGLPDAAARVGQPLPGLPAVGGTEDHRRGVPLGEPAVEREVEDRGALPAHLRATLPIPIPPPNPLPYLPPH